VVAALIAIRMLKEQFGPPKRSLEALSICEEEETRFHANFWGSRAISGQIRPGEVDTIRESNGLSIGDAMRSVGLDPSRIREAVRSDIEAFLELHIEQGPRLEDSSLPVGIVNAITGLRHYVVTIIGRADHAGARPMSSRLDPMAGAAEIISGVIDEAIRMGPPAVTTVGTMVVVPNLTSAVPDRATFTIDARHPDPESLAQLHKHHESKILSVAARRGLKASWTIELDRPPCQCDPELVSLLERTAKAQGIPSVTLHSGAGHDTQQMAEIAKVVMIFVRSVGGRSHTPAEFTTVDDATAGITLLAAALFELAY
jgi:allantoate deiminase